MEQIRARFFSGWFGGLAGGLVIETASHYQRHGWAGFGLALLTAFAGGLAAVVFVPTGRRS